MSRLYLDSISQHESNHDENSKSNAKDKEEEARKPGEGWKGPGEMYDHQGERQSTNEKQALFKSRLVIDQWSK